MPYTHAHKTKSKERILKSATKLFFRFGFDNVSINQVMKLAKMTHGAFYSHFESKEALYKASILETLKNSSARRLAKAPFSIDHLMQLAGNLLTLSEQAQPSLENVLFNEIGSEKPEIRNLYEKSYSSTLELLETRIAALSKLNKMSFGLNQAMIEEKSRAILATLVGAIAIAKSIQSEEEIRRILIIAQNQVLTILGVAELRSCEAAQTDQDPSWP